jgi:hypothetical protein
MVLRLVEPLVVKRKRVVVEKVEAIAGNSIAEEAHGKLSL